MLHKVGRFNDIPKSMLPELPEQDTVVRYRFFSKAVDFETKEPVYPAGYMIPAFSRVKNPDTNQWIDIGLVDAVDAQGTPIPDRVQRRMVRPRQSHGELRLTIGNPQDDELFQFLELHAINASNLNRDTSEAPVLERIYEEQEAEKDMKERQTRKQAMQIAFDLDESQVRQTSFVLGFDASAKPNIQRNAIEDYADKNAEDFLRRYNNPDFQRLAKVKEAMAAGVIEVDQTQRMMKWKQGGNPIMTVADTSPDAAAESFANFLGESKNAPILKSLEALLPKRPSDVKKDGDGDKATPAKPTK